MYTPKIQEILLFYHPLGPPITIIFIIFFTTYILQGERPAQHITFTNLSLKCQNITAAFIQAVHYTLWPP